MAQAQGLGIAVWPERVPAYFYTGLSYRDGARAFLCGPAHFPRVQPCVRRHNTRRPYCVHKSGYRGGAGEGQNPLSGARAKVP